MRASRDAARARCIVLAVGAEVGDGGEVRAVGAEQVRQPGRRNRSAPRSGRSSAASDGQRRRRPASPRERSTSVACGGDAVDREQHDDERRQADRAQRDVARAGQPHAEGEHARSGRRATSPRPGTQCTSSLARQQPDDRPERCASPSAAGWCRSRGAAPPGSSATPSTRGRSRRSADDEVARRDEHRDPDGVPHHGRVRRSGWRA